MPRKRKSSRLNYAKLVSPGTFLGDYLAYMHEQETAYAYDFWTALWLLSVSVGRNIIVDRPRAPVYLNLFCILVAESGITRKSTSVRIATKFARPFCDPLPQLIESKITPENLEKVLHDQAKEHNTSHCAISISELATFLGKERYMEALPALLTDLYDCPELRTGGGTISGGTRRLENVFVSFLSASTPSWLVRAINPNVIEGGFTSRVVFIVEEEPKRLQPWPVEGDERLEDEIKIHLERIRERAREIRKIHLSDGAKRTFAKWYRSRPKYRDPFRSSFQSREDAHILRVAAFLSINDGTWVIHNTHVVSAIKILEQIREDGANIFEGTGSNSKLLIGADKVRDKLLAAGQSGIPQRELTKAVQGYMNAEHMKATLAVMHELGMVQKFENIQVGRGRPTTLWRATAALMQGKALDQIIDGLAP